MFSLGAGGMCKHGDLVKRRTELTPTSEAHFDEPSVATWHLQNVDVLLVPSVGGQFTGASNHPI